MAIDKSKWNTNIKVSQATINQIKKLGMKKALGMVADYANPAVKNLPGNKEIVEGITRLYGADRVSSAIAAKAPKSTAPDSYRGMPPKKSTGSNTVPKTSRPSLSTPRTTTGPKSAKTK